MDADTSPEKNGRPVGTTENGWCRGVPGGTGITVLAVYLSRHLPTASIEKAIHKLQLSNPILRSQIVNNSTRNNHYSFFFRVCPTPTLKVQSFDASATAEVLGHLPDGSDFTLHALVEHDLNLNPWKDHNFSNPIDVLFANLYDIPDGSGASVLVLRAHTAAVDRTSAGAIIVKVIDSLTGYHGCSDNGDENEDVDGSVLLLPPLEDLVPTKLAKKALWARGIGMVGYSMNFLRSSTLTFNDVRSNRASRFVVLELGLDETQKLLSVCKERDIKLCGVLTAAGLIAAVKSKHLPNQKYETHTIVTLMDCRKRLEKELSNRDIGFYHSAIQNAYTVNGEEELWELSTKCHSSYSKAITANKDLQDMADLNILMVKAIENPGMTHSASLRTALISVFAEPEICESSKQHEELGVVAYLACSSTHGVGASIGIFDTIKDGRLICTCLYPSPLHSREVIQGIVDEMKNIIINAMSAITAT